MLIIFDLDDTLIDTTFSITPFKLKASLKKLVEAGLVLPHFDKAYEELLKINQSSKSSKIALHTFLSLVDGERFLDLAIETMGSSLPEDFEVKTVPGAKEILEFLKPRHSLALVTGGKSSFQLQKLKKAGIDHFFSGNIAVSEDFRKKSLYEQAALREGIISFKEVIVCGDREEIDLKPAYELGCCTVHMRWGRNQGVKTKKWIMHSILKLAELKEIVGV